MLSETMERQLRAALDEAYERGYRAGQEDMRGQAVESANEVARSISTDTPFSAYDYAAEMVEDVIDRLRALPIKEVPDAG